MKELRIDDRLAAKALKRLSKYGMKTAISLRSYNNGDLVVGVARRCDDGPLVNKSILVIGGCFDIRTVTDLLFGCPSADPFPPFETTQQYYYH